MVENWIIYTGPLKHSINRISDFSEDSVGFVYKITNTETGKFYIGKKSLYTNVKKTLTKKELAALAQPTRGKKPTTKRVVAESNWLNYWGSNKQLLEDLKVNGKNKYEREILQVCTSKKPIS